MDLRDYLVVLRKRWVTVASVVATAVVAGLVASLLATPMYVATTQTYVSVQGSSNTSDMLQGATFTRQQIASYTKLVTSPLVLGPVVDDLGLDTRVESLAEQITARSPQSSSLIDISVSDASPVMAAAVANAVSDEFRQVVAELERPDGGGVSAVKLTAVRSAVVPESAASPNLKLSLVLALALGLAAGVGLALLRDMLDTRVRDETAAAAITGHSVVGVIIDDDEAASRPLIVQSDPHSPRAEAFRRLRTNVQFLGVDGRPTSLIVTSSIPGEGKSTTTVNLAIALAETGAKVVVVDADLRRPSIARYLGIEGSAGLTTVLIGQAEVTDVVQPWGNGNLHVLSSGQIPPNPSELLGSAAMRRVLDQLCRSYEVVLVDTPPLLPVTDAAVLAPQVGGALVVVGAGRVQRAQLTETMSSLSNVGGNVLGVVVNRAARRQGQQYAYYKYDSQDQTPVAGRGGPGGAGDRVRRSTSTDRTRAAGTRSQGTGPVPVVSTSVHRIWPDQVNEQGRVRSSLPVPPQHQRGSR